MKTLIDANPTDFELASSIIKKGGLVAVPTETVYGLAANALDSQAVNSIFKAKGRPSDNPLIVHIASLDMLESLVKEVPHHASLLIDAFWPGPLTLIFKATSVIPSSVRAGLDTVAVRFPSHTMMLNLIKASDVPLAAPSANTSGKPSPTNAKRVFDDLNGKIDMIIDGGDCSVGLESTVVDLTKDIPIILRPGSITKDMLEEVCGTVSLDPALLSHDETIKPISPGMKYTHYSPHANVIIVKGDESSVINTINTHIVEDTNKGLRVGVLATDETMYLFKHANVLSVGPKDDLSQIASRLFEVLRQFDDYHTDIVYTLSFPKSSVGEAIMNRLEKSAGYNIIHAR